MRLTLRTLLAYLDDTLEPSQAREIGQKVAESDVARELIERIKKVTRRRGLTIPPASGPDKIEANIVAEYLDNDLPSDKVGEVEEHALSSDVVLAEVAACHQILTLVLGEPAHVPPTARQRMYQLVTGRESIRNRRAKRVGPAAYTGESVADRSRNRNGFWLRLLGAGALTAALLFALLQALPGDRGTRGTPDDSGAVADNSPKTDDVKPQPAEPEKAASKAPPEPVPDVPVKPADVPPPVKPAVVRAPAAPSTEQKEVGRLVTEGRALLRRNDDGAWVRVVPDARVNTATLLASLPGATNELRLDSGIEVALWGNLPDLSVSPVLDTRVTLHVPAEGFDADLTLDRGRVYLSSTRKDATKVRVRIADQVWDVTLPNDAAEVLVETSTIFAGEPFQQDGPGEPPAPTAYLGVVKGRATVTATGAKFDLEAPPGPAPKSGPETKNGDAKSKPSAKPAAAEITWNLRTGLRKDAVLLVEAPPSWARLSTRPMPIERARAMEAAQKKLAQRLGEAGKSVDLALAEMADDTAVPNKVLGVYCQGTLDMLPRLLDSLEDPAGHDVRLAAVNSLHRFIARASGNGVQAYTMLVEKKGYTEPQASVALRLLHGASEAALSEPATYQAVIAALSSDRVGLRELAGWRLAQLDPEGASRIFFRAGDPEALRDRAIAEWKRRIPDGKLPPFRNGAQGRAGAAVPARG